MQTVRVLGALALSVTIGLCVVLLWSSAAVRPVYAEDGPPPRSRAESPTAEVIIYVDRDIDTNLSTCSAAANDCTLRGAINKANSDPANIYTIYFSPTVTLIALLNPLPTISANELYVVGVSGVPRIDGLFMSAGDPFTINAAGVRLSGLSIVNVGDAVAVNYADIRVIGGTRVQIYGNYLGTLPPSPEVTNCTPNPLGGGAVSRNAAYGIFVESGVTGNSSAGNGSVYIGGNTIGCHLDTGILVSGADYVRIGEDHGVSGYRNYIGVNVSSVPITHTFDGIAMMPTGSNNAPRYNVVRNNIIAGNGRHGIAISGNGTANTNSAIGNTIIGNRIGLAPNGSRLSNGWDGVRLANAAFQNFVGGTGANDGNIISGNGNAGVQIASGVGNGVLGNYIGTTVTGTAGLGNAWSGVRIYGGSANVVGGAIYGFLPATQGNSIYSNGQDGVQLVEGASNNLVLANDIRYNTLSGVGIASGAYDNVVGGDVITSLNIIGNNGGYGVYLHGSTTTGNVVKYNDILNNGSDGVTIQADAHDNEIGGAILQTFNLIRYNQGSGIGVIDSGPNTISYNGIIGNGKYGVILDGSSTQGTLITGTAIVQNGYDGLGERNSANFNAWSHVSLFENGGLAVDKSASSDTTNIVNPPTAVITSVVRNGGQTVVRGTGLAGTLIELYGVAPDPSGFGEGKTYVGTAVISAGKWVVTDTLNLGCYTLFENLLGLATTEFGPNSCRVFLPGVLK